MFKLMERKENRADFIIVGPIKDEAKRVTGKCGFSRHVGVLQ